MIAIEVITIVVMVVVARRSRPPEHRAAVRVLSTLAGSALVSFGIAMGSLMLVGSGLAFGIALFIAGLTASTFLWLARGEIDDDDSEDGGEPPNQPPTVDPDSDRRRFMRKRTQPTGPKTPSRRT